MSKPRFLYLVVRNSRSWELKHLNEAGSVSLSGHLETEAMEFHATMEHIAGYRDLVVLAALHGNDLKRMFNGRSGNFRELHQTFSTNKAFSLVLEGAAKAGEVLHSKFK